MFDMSLAGAELPVFLPFCSIRRLFLVTALTTPPPLSHKDLRYFLRDGVRDLHRPGSNPRRCGRVRREPNVQIRIKDGSAWFHGLVNCGQLWVCPVCAYRIGKKRGKELSELIRAHRKTGGDVCLVTATMPHDQGDRLKRIRQVVSEAWSKSTTGRPWVRLKKELGIEGWTRALEVTHGRNGWHPHVHGLIFTRHLLKEAQVATLRDSLYRTWSRSIEAAGYRRPTREHGLVVSHGEAAGEYVTKITKQGLAEEIGNSDSKQGRFGSRSILQIMYDYTQDHNLSDKRLIREFFAAMHGARQLTWSNGFRKRYLSAEQLDLDLVQDREWPGEDVLVVISGQTWDLLVKADSSLPRRLIDAAEKSGRPGVYSLLVDASAALPVCPTAPP